MLKRIMHKRERHFAMLNDNRVVHPFEWGAEFIAEHVNGDDPRKLFAEHTRRVLADSDEYFAAPQGMEYRLQAADGMVQEEGRPEPEPQTLSWPSNVRTPSAENNTAYATYFPHETNRRAAVIILPHWQATVVP